jgi:hypothetical protein
MAGRTSASFGITLTIIILSVLTLGLFVAFAVFFGKYSDAQQKLAQAKQDNQEVVGSERNRDDVRVLIEEAKKSPQRSLVAYLVANRDELVQTLSGDRRDTGDTLKKKLEAIDAQGQPLISVVQARDASIKGLESERDQLKSARDQAVADLKNMIDQTTQLDTQRKESMAQQQKMIDDYKAEIESYRSGTDTYRENLAKQLETVTNERNEVENRLQEQLKEQTEKTLIVEAQLAKLRGDQSKQLFRGQDEATLVDGEVIGTNEVDRTVVLNVGRNKKIVLGMTFAAYPNAAAIRSNAEGEYAAGKATLEVINVGDTTSVARITSELRGNPVVRGDVIANAVYDPNKVYSFVVFGNFDTDRDAIATQAERGDIEAMVRGWGGEVVDDLTGDTDFLVLGERPQLPPRPGASAPLEVALEFQRRFNDVEKYDSLLRQATATGVPVLNENRLYTLTGRAPARPRR